MEKPSFSITISEKNTTVRAENRKPLISLHISMCVGVNKWRKYIDHSKITLPVFVLALQILARPFPFQAFAVSPTRLFHVQVSPELSDVVSRPQPFPFQPKKSVLDNQTCCLK